MPPLDIEDNRAHNLSKVFGGRCKLLKLFQTEASDRDFLRVTHRLARDLRNPTRSKFCRPVEISRLEYHTLAAVLMGASGLSLRHLQTVRADR